MDKGEWIAYVFFGFVVVIAIFCFFEIDSRNTEAQIDCYESIANDFCQDKGLILDSVVVDIFRDINFFECNKEREVRYTTFTFYDEERKQCNKLIVTTKRGFW